MGKAGVDTAVFKAHSVHERCLKYCSLREGSFMEDILRTADWSTDSTFQRFYYRPTHDNRYAVAVLQPQTAEGEHMRDQRCGYSAGLGCGYPYHGWSLYPRSI